jgi:hypothetical protein
MYRCDLTKQNSRPGQKLNKITVVKRPQTYFKYVKNEDSRIWERVQAGTGWEIVHELNLSAEGLALWESWSEEDRTNYLRNQYPHFFKETNV